MAVPPGVIQDVAKWLQEQQDYEEANGKPAPMHDSIRDALCQLHALLKPASPVSYNQGKRPASSAPSYTDEAGGDMAHLQRWISRVTLEEHSQSFPNPSSPGSDPYPPSFGRKKDARQYAAKCAVSWLLDQRLMPATWLMAPGVPSTAAAAAAAAAVANNHVGASAPVASPAPVVVPTVSVQARQGATPQSSPPAKKQKTETAVATSSSSSVSTTPAPAEETTSAGASLIPSPAPTPTPAPPPQASSSSSSTQQQQQAAKSAPHNGNSAFGGSSVGEPSAEQEVVEICKKLKIPTPTYKITANTEQPGFWSGHAEFGSGANANLPPDCGRVEDVYGGKKNAREAIAGKVLVELRKILDQRTRTYDELVKNMSF
ncbi:hypothetical protein G7054_g3274 [Neopestalotiopsis clavispora]|nr:hypothetical protein G7054_g3274 [Neopestalotiopsis clavispora]